MKEVRYITQKEVSIEYIIQYLAENGKWYTVNAFPRYKSAFEHYQELIRVSELSHRLVMHVDTLAVLEEARHD